MTDQSIAEETTFSPATKPSGSRPVGGAATFVGAVMLVLVVALACQSPHAPVERTPVPPYGPDGAWREVQNALHTRNELWLGSRIASAATPQRDEAAYTARVQLAQQLMQNLAPRIDHALLVTDTPEVWYHFDRAGQFVGGRATLYVHVESLALYDHGEGLAAWTERLENDPTADPHGTQETYLLLTGWVVEQDDWRLRHLELQDSEGNEVWRLPTRPRG